MDDLDRMMVEYRNAMKIETDVTLDKTLIQMTMLYFFLSAYSPVLFVLFWTLF